MRKANPMPFELRGHAVSTGLWGGGDDDGARVLALHGFTGSGADFGPLVRGCSGAVSFLAPDLPGHGAYRAPGPSFFYGFDAARAVVRATREHAGWLRPSLLGYSMGARVALDLAVASPEAVSSLILIGGRPGLEAAEEREARMQADECLAEELERDGVQGFLQRWQAQPLIASQARIGEPYRGEMLLRRQRADGLGWARSLRALGTGAMEPLWGKLGTLTCPVLLVVGEEDQKFLAIAEQMHALMPSSELVVIAGEVGHAAHLEDPVTTGREVEAFLGRLV